MYPQPHSYHPTARRSPRVAPVLALFFAATAVTCRIVAGYARHDVSSCQVGSGDCHTFATIALRWTLCFWISLAGLGTTAVVWLVQRNRRN